jgi:uncharacterized membrane protein
MAGNDDLATKIYENGVRISAAVTIQRSASELYKVWHGFTDLPRFIDDLKTVERTGAALTRWTVRGPGGKDYSWDAEIINDEPNKRIAWRTTDDKTVANAGTVSFRELPFQRGTEVKVVIEYIPPAGSAGDAVAKMMKRDPKTLVQRAMFRFRQLMEAGEVSTIAGQSVGEGNRTDTDDDRQTEADLRDLAGTGVRS